MLQQSWPSVDRELLLYIKINSYELTGTEVPCSDLEAKPLQEFCKVTMETPKCQKWVSGKPVTRMTFTLKHSY